MARTNRSAYSFLGVSVVTTLLVAACGGGNDQGVTNNDQTGGVVGTSTKATGGKAAGTGGKAAGGGAPTGGKAATGGTAATATGGTKAATGGAPSTAATGGAPTSTGGAPASTGGTSGTAGGASATGGSGTPGGASATGGKTGTTGGASATGGSGTPGGASATGGKSSTGGSSTAGGASATGGTTQAGGASATGGTSAGGSSSLQSCASYSGPGAGGAGGAAPIFCTVTNSTIPLSTLCVTGCGSGDVNLVGSSSGLTVSGIVYSASYVFNANPVQTTTETPPRNCDGFSATNPSNGQLYSSVVIGLTNNMSTAQIITVGLTDIAHGTGGYYTETLATSIPVAAGASVSKTLLWSDFVPTCQLPANVAFDQRELLKLGLGLGQAGVTTYPINGVNFTVTSVGFN